jgi:hypothetical protein
MLRKNGRLSDRNGRGDDERRSIHVRLTKKGIKLRDGLTGMHRRHAEMLSRTAVSADELQTAGVTLPSARALLDPSRRFSAAAAARSGFFVPGSASFRLMHSPTRWFMGSRHSFRWRTLHQR